MDDLLCAAQVEPTQQQRVSELAICSLKEIFPSLLGDVKDSVSLKKMFSGDGDGYWSTIKEILGWVIGTHRSTLVLSSKQHLQIISLLVIPDSHRRISAKNLECLISKLRSMHLLVLGSIWYFYTMHFSLTRT